MTTWPKAESRRSWAPERAGFSQENLTPGDGVPAGCVLEGPLMGRTPATFLSLSPKESTFTLWLGVGTGTGSNKDSRWSLRWLPTSNPIGLSVEQSQEVEQGAGLVALQVTTCSLLEAPETMWEIPRARLGLLHQLVWGSPAALGRGRGR